jgi:phenylalanyl-tRNA synthetase beta chain
MKISLSTIRGMNKRYGCADDIAQGGADELAVKIGAQLGAIEEVEHIGEKYHGIVIAKVVHCRKHEDSDHLNVCRIDDGGITPDVKRDEEGLVQVVCGAPNVREGLVVAWLPPGTTVPESVGKDPFVLSARELRGELSNGMLASPRELALGDNHDGILEIIDPFDRVHPGDDFAAVFELKDDVVFDIENKMFTHRPDCFGFLGVSRELAGIQQQPFHSPAWYRRDAGVPEPEVDVLPFKVRNEIPELVPRFTAVVLRDVKVGPSPTWLVVELAKVGLRSINNIVDYTNFFMLETGQPLHAYDYDKVRALDGGDTATLVVRYPKPGEKITLLNGKEIQPRDEAIMIATENKLIGVGGVMGGGETEVDDTTRNIIIECATFDMYSIRRTSMAHGLFTDAVTRFNKGQSPLQNQAVIAKIVDEVRKFAGGKVASELVDLSTVSGRAWVHPPVPITAVFINERLGFNLSAEEVKQLLENVEFAVDVEGGQLTVVAPFWRTDIESREDVVEEVGRLYGYDKLPLELPRRSIKPVEKDEKLELKAKIRDALAKAGANEVLTYSFVHGDLLTKVGQNKDLAFQISNALSPNLQYYRLSLTPSLLDKVHANVKAGYDEFAIFELGKGHNLMHDAGAEDDGVPQEFEFLDLVYTSAKKDQAGAALYGARAFLDALAASFGCDLSYAPVTKDPAVPVADVYDLARAASVTVRQTGEFLGMVGEFKPQVRKALKLPARSAGFCVGMDPLLNMSRQRGEQYRALSRFPEVTQDMTLKVPAGLAYQTLFDHVRGTFMEQDTENTRRSVWPLDIYQRDDDPEHKQVTFRFVVAHYARTLTDQEVAKLLDNVADAAQKAYGAERV